LSTVSDPRWVVTLNPKNVGVAEGNNQGIVQALRDGCEWVILLNNDTTFEPGFLRLLIQACARNDWRVVVPKIHFDTPAGHLWYAGGGFNPRRGHTGFHAGLGERDHGQFNSETTVDYSPTCAMLIHRSVFHEVGVMDETYFVYFDDTDFCWRLRKAGVPIGYTATTCLVHKVGGSTGGTTSPFTAKITARNRLYFLHKHFGAATAFSWTPVFLLYYLVRYGLRWNIKCIAATNRRFAGTRPSVSTYSQKSRGLLYPTTASPTCWVRTPIPHRKPCR
jgi:GT2 family glycosyltransferase